MLLRNTVHSDEEVCVINNIFDRIYSFDINDCKKYNLTYLNQFYYIGFKQYRSITPRIILKSKCFFLGQDKNRITILRELVIFLQLENSVVDFHIVRDITSLNKFDHLYSDSKSYIDGLSLTLESEILVDITKDNRIGLTIRPFEAIFLIRN